MKSQSNNVNAVGCVKRIIPKKSKLKNALYGLWALADAWLKQATYLYALRTMNDEHGNEVILRQVFYPDGRRKFLSIREVFENAAGQPIRYLEACRRVAGFGCRELEAGQQFFRDSNVAAISEYPLRVPLAGRLLDKFVQFQYLCGTLPAELKEAFRPQEAHTLRKYQAKLKSSCS